MGERIRLECGLFGSFCRDGGQEGLRSPVLGFRLGSGGVGGGGGMRRLLRKMTQAGIGAGHGGTGGKKPRKNWELF